MNTTKLFLALALYIQLVYGRLPDGSFPKCNRIDPGLTQCLIQGIEVIRPILAKGIPEVNLPSLESFTLQNVDIDSPTWMPGFKLKGVLTNIEVNGLSGFTVETFVIDTDKREVKAKIVVPQVKVSAKYNTKGSQAFFVALERMGKLNGTFNNVTATMRFRGTIEKKNDLNYLRIPYVKVKINIGTKFDIDIKPDHSGQPSTVLADMLKKTPKQMLMKIVNTAINNNIAPTIKNYINSIAKNIPLQDLLID